MTVTPQVFQPNLVPKYSLNSTQRYLLGIFNKHSRDVSGIVVRQSHHIDRYASRSAVLNEAHKLGWTVFITGSHWVIIPKNREVRWMAYSLAD